ncbi:hypothetical protein [Hydrogenimonas sp.]|uniref:hypothetical protein n=1 Tax=Hydrogenimonas sp. TaxID=2231112 RepID=UPI00262DAFD4|nr:hypothetical protein [Hydrogenimonas sp.]
MDSREILEIVAEKTPSEYIGEMQETISSMVCNENQPMPLSEKTLYEALALKGEFLVLKLTYDDVRQELKEQKIRRKITQSLSIVAVYEDAGHSLDDIENSIKYIHDLVDEKQNFVFGIKRVDSLSEFPVTILFSGILPINQLELYIGEEIDRLIHSDDDYFIPRFKQVRDEISEVIGIPILPLDPKTDSSLNPSRARLVDGTNGHLISEFEVDPFTDKEGLEIYLLKFFYIYKKLGDDMRNRMTSHS